MRLFELVTFWTSTGHQKSDDYLFHKFNKNNSNNNDNSDDGKDDDNDDENDDNNKEEWN